MIQFNVNQIWFKSFLIKRILVIFNTRTVIIHRYWFKSGSLYFYFWIQIHNLLSETLPGRAMLTILNFVLFLQCLYLLYNMKFYAIILNLRARNTHCGILNIFILQVWLFGRKKATRKDQAGNKDVKWKFSIFFQYFLLFSFRGIAYSFTFSC